MPHYDLLTPPPPWNVDDVTRAMSKGGVLANVQEWGSFSIFRRADDVTQTMSKGGGVLVNVFTPPPLQETAFRFRPPPPPPGWLATGLHVLGISVNSPPKPFCPPMYILFVCSQSCFYTFSGIDYRLGWVEISTWRKWAGLADKSATGDPYFSYKVSAI